MIRHTSPISGIDCLGNWIATAGYDNRLILWEFQSGKTPRAVAVGMHDHLVNQCRFSHDGRLIVSASSDYTARIWSCAPASLQLETVLTGHADDVEMACFSASDHYVATASRDHCIRIYDLSGKCLQTLDGHSKDVLSVHWLRNDELLVSSGDDGCVLTWDVSTGQVISALNLGDTEADTIAIGADGIVFAGDDTGAIMSIAAQEKSHYFAHQSGIKRLAINAQKNLLLSAGYDRNLSVWDVSEASLALRRQVSIPEDAWPRSFCISDDARYVHMGSFGGIFRSYDTALDSWYELPDNSTLGLNALAFHEGHLWSVGDAGLLKSDAGDSILLGSLCNTLLSTKNGLLAAGQQGVIFLIKKQIDGQYVVSQIYQHTCPINCSAIISDDGTGQNVILGTYNGELIRISFQSGSVDTIQSDCLPVVGSAIKDVTCFDPQHLFLVCANGDAVWLTSEGLISTHLRGIHSKIANACVRLGPNLVASVSRDRCLYLWSREHLISKIPSPNSHSIKCMAWSDPWIITGSYNGSLHFYDLSRSEWCPQLSRPTVAGISSLLVGNNRDGIRANVYASSYDGRIYNINFPPQS
jgi:WD40 repeat protein